MKISQLKSNNIQLRLFDDPLISHAYVRNYLGNFVEDLTAYFFNGERHKTDSRCDYCPDVSISPSETVSKRIYLECKSVGKGGQVFVYSGRIEKDIEFSNTFSLFYVIWHHKTQTRKASTARELKTLFLQNLCSTYLVPFSVIHEKLMTAKKMKLNSGYGGTNREVYGDGRRFSVRLLDDWKVIEWENGIQTESLLNVKSYKCCEAKSTE